MAPCARALPTLCLLASLAAAQPAPGDWIGSTTINNGSGGSEVLVITPSSGNRTTLVPTTPGIVFNWMSLAANNVDLASPRYATSLATADLVAVAPNGNLTTIATFPAGFAPSGLDLDQDGTYVATTFAGMGFFRVDPASGMVTPLYTAAAGIQNVTIDQDTGDYVLAVNNGRLLRLQRVTLAVSTLAVLANASAVDFEPRTGDFVCSSFSPGSAVMRATRAGVVTTLNPTFPPVANTIKVDDETGNFLAGGSTTAALLSPAGGILTAHNLPLPTGSQFTGLEIYGSRKVTGTGTALPLSVYTINFSFPQSPGANYVAAMSTGLRPGIALPDGRTVNLDFTSPLFLLSIGGLPGVNTGFSGTLSPLGTATGTIAIPNGVPPGIRIFTSAVAVNVGFPSGLDTANTWGFTTN